MTDPTLVFKADTSDLKKADKVLADVQKQAIKTDEAVEGFNETVGGKGKPSKPSIPSASDNAKKSFGKFVNSFKPQANAVQVAAFQIQDALVQFEAQFRASTIAAQQLPQLFGVFGAGGAIVGAVASLASIVGADFVNALVSSKNAATELNVALDDLSRTVTVNELGVAELSEEFKILAETSEEVAKVRLEQELIKAAKASGLAFANLENTVESLDVRLENIRGITGRTGAIDRLANSYGIAGEEADRLRKAANKAIDSKSLADAEALSRTINEIALSNEDANKKFIKLADSANIATQSLRDQKAITDLLNESRKNTNEIVSENTRTLEEESAKQIEIEQNKQNEMLNIFLRGNQKDQEIYDKQIEDEKRAQELRIKNTQRFTQSSLRIIEQGAEEGSALAKAAFIANKAISIAQMIVNTEDAATQALAYGAQAGPAIAAVIRGIGYTSVGIAAGQTISGLSGRAQGGQVRAGQSYVVGENGREVLTMGNMGGNITPNNKLAANDGAPMQVVTNVKIIGGNADSKANTSITKTDRQYIIDVVVDQMSNPSSKGRAGMARTSNIQNRGVR